MFLEPHFAVWMKVYTMSGLSHLNMESLLKVHGFLINGESQVTKLHLGILSPQKVKRLVGRVFPRVSFSEDHGLEMTPIAFAHFIQPSTPRISMLFNLPKTLRGRGMPNLT